MSVNGQMLCDHCRPPWAAVRMFEAFAKEWDRPRRPCEVCPNCGVTAEEIGRLGVLGCPLCYEVFPAEIWRFEP